MKDLPAGLRPLAVTIDQAVKLTGVSRSRLYVAMQLDNLKFIQYGRRRLIRLDALEAFLRELEAANRETLLQARLGTGGA